MLLAYAKLTLNEDLVGTDLPDDPALERELMAYFPERMREQYAGDIAGHRLKREIVVTAIANAMINRGGPTYLTRVGDQTGVDAATVARAYVAVRDVFGLDDLNAEIDGLDGKVGGTVQLQLYRAAQDLLLAETVWFVRNVSFGDGVAGVVARFGPAVAAVGRGLAAMLPPRLAEEIARNTGVFVAAGVGEGLAARIAALPVVGRTPDILLAAEASGRSFAEAVAVYLAVAEDLHIGRLAGIARGIAVTDYYDELALDRAVEMLGIAQRRIAVAALRQRNGSSTSLDSWRDRQPEKVARVLAEVAAITEGGVAPSVSAIGVAAGLIADLAGQE